MDKITFYLDNFNNLHIKEGREEIDYIKVLYYNTWFNNKFFENIEYYIKYLYDEIYYINYKDSKLKKCTLLDLEYYYYLNN